MKECVVIDCVRCANVRAHNEKGWFRHVRPEQMLIPVYKALFERNPKVKPEEVEAVFCGSANQSGMQNDIARLQSGLGCRGVRTHLGDEHALGASMTQPTDRSMRGPCTDRDGVSLKQPAARTRADVRGVASVCRGSRGR